MTVLKNKVESVIFRRWTLKEALADARDDGAIVHNYKVLQRAIPGVRPGKYKLIITNIYNVAFD